MHSLLGTTDHDLDS